MSGPDKLLLSVRETADATGLGETLVKQKIRSGELPSLTIGDRRLVRTEDLRRFIDRLAEEAQGM